MTDDTISRAAAIQTAERMYKRCDTSSIADYHDLMVEAITELPSAQPDVPGINVIIDTIKNAINASTGNEAYMVGLRNGMRWCWSALTDKEPVYEDMPPAQPVEDIHREKEQAYYCGYEDGAKAARSAQPGEDVRAMCGECDAWNKYKNYPQTEQFNPCTVCQEFDCSGCKFRRT